MALSICQDQDYLGIRRWRWAVWVDGTPEELDSVDHVTYILHPTFHNPVKVVHNRETKFRLEATGWGTFTVYAKVMFRNGEESTIQHDLVLVYPDGTPTLA
ncbi:MAG: hypothetical protein JO022_00475 [Acidobacteriaceae bacterium]|nr:hypothetical protein [Acidobacteriaceae bacterium]